MPSTTETVASAVHKLKLFCLRLSNTASTVLQAVRLCWMPASFRLTRFLTQQTLPSPWLCMAVQVQQRHSASKQ
jgi:hypothetical protein